MRTEPLMNFSYKQDKKGRNYPEIQISENAQNDNLIVGQFGSLWKNYMMEQYPYRLSELVAQGKINEVILQVDEEAQEKKEALIQKILAIRPLPDTEDTRKRARHMNGITKEAEEIVIHEVILKIR